MNLIILSGRITKNLELKYTINNKAIIETNIAVKRGFNGEVDFINIQVWGKQAENLTKYCGKGSMIALNGELRIDTFDKNDGTKGYKNYVLVNSIEFLDGKKNVNNKESEQKEEAKKEEKVETSNPYQDFANEFDTANLELPF